MNIFTPNYEYFGIFNFALKTTFIKNNYNIGNHMLIYIIKIIYIFIYIYIILNKYENIICFEMNQQFNSIISLFIYNVL